MASNDRVAEPQKSNLVAVRLDDLADSDFAAAVDSHLLSLVRFAFLVSGDRDGADDLVSDAIANALPHWRRGRVDDVRWYLQRAIANGARNRHRRRVVEDRGRRLATSPAVVPSAQDQIADRDQIWRAIQHLQPAQRAVIVLRYYEDRSEAEIGQILRVSPGTVKSRASRAIKEMRRFLERERPEREVRR